MSVVGIDFGNANNRVALARRKGIDVVLNEESKRETPSMVNFGEKQVENSTLNPKTLRPQQPKA
jgi:heat shock protein 4